MTYPAGTRVVVTCNDPEDGGYQAGETGAVIPQEPWDDEAAISCVYIQFDVPQPWHVDGRSWVALGHLQPEGSL